MFVGYRALGLSTVQTGLIGLGAAIGHGYPLCFHFKDGRGAAALMGIYLLFLLYELLISFLIVPPIVLKFFRRDVSVRVPTGILCLSTVLMFFMDRVWPVRLMALAYAAGTAYFSAGRIFQITKEYRKKRKAEKSRQSSAGPGARWRVWRPVAVQHNACPRQGRRAYCGVRQWYLI